MKTNVLVAKDGLKERIKSELPVEDVIQSLGPKLSKVGKELRGPCPFHEDDDPSFYVSPDKGLWVCHGCKKGGDIISFVEQLYGITYVEALYRLAELADIDTSDYERPLTAAELEQKKLTEELEQYISKQQRPYGLRGLSKETLDAYKIRTVHEPPKTYTWAPDFGRSELWDNTTMYPIYDHTGTLHSIMFRPNKKGLPKYLRTSSNFPLSTPGVVLYGFNLARKDAAKYGLVLVEGQHDVLALHDCGMENVAGLNGTNFGEEHMAFLKEHKITKVTLLLDNDQSGRARSLVIAKKLAALEPRLFIATLREEGADPDDMIAADMGQYLLEDIDNAKDALEYVIDCLWNEKPRTTMTAKLDFASDIRDFLKERAIPQVELGIVATKIGELIGVPTLEIMDLISNEQSSKLYSTESERVILGSILRDPNKIVTYDVPEQAFYLSRHRIIYRMIKNAYDGGVHNLDMVAFTQQAQAMGIDQAVMDTSYISNLLELPELNIPWHIEVVRDTYFRRSVLGRITQVSNEVSDLKVNAIESVSMAIADIVGLTSNKETDEFSTIKEATDSTMELLYDRAQNESPIVGLDLGPSFPVLNRSLLGLIPGKLSLILSLQGRGKTALLGNFANAISVQAGEPALFIELEMCREELVFRFLALLTGVEHQRIVAGLVSKEEIKKIETAAIRLRQSPLHIYAPSGLTQSMLEMVVRRYKLQHGIKAVFLDYAQLVSPDEYQYKMARYLQLGELSRSMKMSMARELDLAMVVAAQLSREASKITESTSEQVGDSYMMAQNSDISIIMRETKEKQIELWLDKNRGGRAHILMPVVFNKDEQYMYETMDGMESPPWRIS